MKNIQELIRVRNKNFDELFSIKDMSGIDDNDLFYKKLLVLAKASSNEKSIISILKNYIAKNTSKIEIIELCTNKCFDRNFHTFFNWDCNNINSFLGIFGEEFKKKCNDEIISNDELKKACYSFLRIGQYRNYIIHNDFLNYPFNDCTVTFEELCEMCESSTRLIEYLESKFL